MGGLLPREAARIAHGNSQGLVRQPLEAPIDAARGAPVQPHALPAQGPPSGSMVHVQAEPLRGLPGPRRLSRGERRPGASLPRGALSAAQAPMTWGTTIWIMLLCVSTRLCLSIRYNCGTADDQHKLPSR